MKTCPFCAESDLQDAAIVCKHCGRDLPTTAAAPARSKRGRGLLIVAVAVLAVAGMAMVGWLQGTPEPGCAIHANSAVVPRDASTTGNASSDLLVIRNLDAVPWSQVEVAVYGFVTVNGPGAPSGRYTATRPSLEPEGLLPISLNDFQDADGRSWVSATMTVDGVDLQAVVNGTRCTGSGSDGAVDRP